MLIDKRQSGCPRILLDALFRLVNPMEVLWDELNFSFPPKNHFRNPKQERVTAILKHYHPKSGDELEAIIEEGFNHYDGEAEGALAFVLKFAEKVLVGDPSGNQIKIHFKHFLRWRQASYLLTQDLFVTAWLAKKRPSKNLKKIEDFSWPWLLGSDNEVIHEIFKEKPNDHHAHLNVVAPVFLPNWLSLMNSPLKIEERLREAGIVTERFSPHLLISDDFPVCTFPVQVQIAAILRFFLVKAIKGEKDLEWTEVVNKGMVTPGFLSRKLLDLQNSIGALMLSQAPFRIASDLPDYALVLLDDCKETHFKTSAPDLILHAGERKLMYDMAGIACNSASDLGWILPYYYAYLLIKHQLRGEFLVINSKVGFRNFLDYQERKDKITDRHPAMKKYRDGQAIASYLKTVGQVEFRFNPGSPTRNTPRKLKHYLLKRRSQIEKSPSGEGQNTALTEMNPTNYSFLAHFIKTKYKFEPESKGDLRIHPRHFKLRKSVKEQAINIRELEHHNANSPGLISGIDAAASEIQCRPEVFATAFRYLRGECRKEFKIKHHTGEEFMDPIDGMRYIDESIRFMELKSGDHLGHVLALGIDLHDWYSKKGYRVHLTRQDFIDNVIWLIGKSDDLNLVIPDKIFDFLFDELVKAFCVVFPNYKSEKKDAKKREALIRNYFNSWKLRGNDPCYYSKGLDRWSPYNWSSYQKHTDDTIGLNQQVLDLINMYHFDPVVKKSGAEMLNVKVHRHIIEWVIKFQTEFRKHVQNKGIVFEVLPSCNVLLSTFGTYINHPIFKFFPIENIKQNVDRPRVIVSTDNPGIFETNLEIEYTLLACAVDKENKLNTSLGLAPFGDWETYLKELKKQSLLGA